MESMKIAIDCHNLEGQRTGVGRYLANLLREWKYQTEADLFLYFKNEIPEDVRGFALHMRNLGGGSNAFFKHWLLPRAAAKDKIDVLFCPDYVLPQWHGGGHYKTAVTIHDIIYEARPAEYSWPSWADKVLLKWASKQSAKKADVIFTPSEFSKNEILKYYKINPQKVMVTPLAPDPIFKQIKQPERAGQPKYILFVGSIFNRRFLPQAIQGFIQFAKSSSDFSPYGGSPAGRQFLIVGKNHTKPFQNIGALVAEANRKLGREVVMWRERASDEELVYLYNGAFATLWLSSYEGFGLPVLESMACGTPVVTSMRGSVPEIAGDAAMYIAHPENPEEISNALTRLFRDDSYRDELIAKGLLQAAKFSWQKCAQETIDFLLKLCYADNIKS